jgi:hypothetical protein
LELVLIDRTIRVNLESLSKFRIRPPPFEESLEVAKALKVLELPIPGPLFGSRNPLAQTAISSGDRLSREVVRYGEHRLTKTVQLALAVFLSLALFIYAPTVRPATRARSTAAVV